MISLFFYVFKIIFIVCGIWGILLSITLIKSKKEYQYAAFQDGYDHAVFDFKVMREYYNRDRENYVQIEDIKELG